MKWSEEEIEYLYSNYPLESAQHCATYLNRSVQSVRAKASKLNIKRLNNPCEFKTTDKYDTQLLNTTVQRLETYQGAQTPILHKCKICAREWKIRPTHVLSGKACVLCANSGGYDTAKPGTLYLVELDIGEGEALYKLGITNLTVNDRLGFELRKFKGNICWELYSLDGQKIKDLETQLKQKYKDNQYNTGLLKSGNTETYDCYINKPEL